MANEAKHQCPGYGIFIFFAVFLCFLWVADDPKPPTRRPSPSPPWRGSSYQNSKPALPEIDLTLISNAIADGMSRLQLLQLHVDNANAFVRSRTWTSADGKFATNADLLEQHGGTAFLRIDGRIKPVEISRLSDADQEFLKPLKSDQIIVGRVVGLSHGDTITVRSDADSATYKIRLEGIDAPESHQGFGTKARKVLGEKIFNTTVQVEWQSKDKYGRTLGHVISENGDWVNHDMVAEGFAWHYKQYSNSAVLAESEQKARAARLGQWADQSPIAPWDFRHPPVAVRGPPASEFDANSLFGSGTNDVTVYGTRTGSKYHRAGCRYLAKSSIPLKLGEASRRYSPCSVCNPSRASTATASTTPPRITNEPKIPVGTTVYITRTGSKYHRAGCRYLARSSIPMDLDAVAARYSPCSVRWLSHRMHSLASKQLGDIRSRVSEKLAYVVSSATCFARMAVFPGE